MQSTTAPNTIVGITASDSICGISASRSFGAFTSRQEATLVKNLCGELRTRSEVSQCLLHDGIIMRSGHVWIPENLKQYVLNELHSTHCKISKMKAITRQTVYWKNIDKDIESLVTSCKECAINQKNSEPAPPHPWDMPKE